MRYKIILTGPECSGKTTLCKKLAKHFNLPFNQEYAREYLSKLNRNYVKSDLLNIAKKQLHSEKHKLLLDTDLLTIKVWSEFKYNTCHKWIINTIKKQQSQSRFYLLCKGDIDWKNDPLRENPHNREKIFNLYETELITLQHQYYIIEKENRLTDAISKIKELQKIN